MNQGISNLRRTDWGKTSKDYAQFRPGYPEGFYGVLAALGVGLRGQRMLDLGTGTGVLAREFARRGADVTGIDISENQINEAKKIADEDGIQANFHVCAAENMNFPSSSIDVVSAGQSWHYFDLDIVLDKVLDILTSEGCLVLTHLLWLPRKDNIAHSSEQLVLKHNPDWKFAGCSGAMPAILSWSADKLELKSYHVMEQQLPFTRESWRGRFRACQGVGASLSQQAVAEFDAEHDILLKEIAGNQFNVWHQMIVHIYVRKGTLG